jgi:hypothetical protein
MSSDREGASLVCAVIKASPHGPVVTVLTPCRFLPHQHLPGFAHLIVTTLPGRA